jgi:hypothetical protein
MPGLTDGEQRLDRLAKAAFLGATYKDMLRARVARVRERYGLEAGPMEYRPELWDGEEQGELFPLQ